MFVGSEERTIEEVCYEKEHIEKVLKVIKENFDKYFTKFIETENGIVMSKEEINEIANDIGIRVLKTNENSPSEKYRKIMIEAIQEFEKDREKYLKIMNKEYLDEYEEEVAFFKNKVLKNECPIIHSTLQNITAKALDKYRMDFNLADPAILHKVVTNLNNFSIEYENKYDTYKDKTISSYEELELELLDTDDYTAYGVIGGGIKSHLLYKRRPQMFANRSRDAIWALWFLTEKKIIDTKMDSEFIMIDTQKTTTQQNYFYPYCLFSFYAINIYYLLKEKANELEVEFPDDYKYVIVDAFLSFVAERHRLEIDLFTSNIKEGDRYYGA